MAINEVVELVGINEDEAEVEAFPEELLLVWTELGDEVNPTEVVVPEVLTWLLLEVPPTSWEELVVDVKDEVVDDDNNERVEVVEELTAGCVDVDNVKELGFTEVVQDEDGAKLLLEALEET